MVQFIQQLSDQPSLSSTPKKVTQWKGNQQRKKAMTTAATVHNTLSSPLPSRGLLALELGLTQGVGGLSVLLQLSWDLKEGMLGWRDKFILPSPVSAIKCLPIAQ